MSRRLAAAAAIAALALGGAACSGDDGDAGPEEPGVETPQDTTGMTTGEGGDSTGDGLQQDVEEPAEADE